MLVAICAMATLPTIARGQPYSARCNALLTQSVEQAAKFPTLHALIVAQDGEPVVERVFRGPSLDTPVNIKSASKTIMATLIGMAVDRGLLTLDQPIAPLLADDLPSHPDPRLARITIGHLLSMQAGLESTSGTNYNAWMASRDWARYVLSRPFVADPGGRMIYSTGSSHLLSVILARLTGHSALTVAREWLGGPLGISIPAWKTDRRGVYLGGNDMMLSPRALLRIGELYRNGGVADGRRILSEQWVRAAWTPRVRSSLSEGHYGYAWFVTRFGDRDAYYAWGYGGQYIHVVPSLRLTTVITSDSDTPSGPTGYARAIQAFIGQTLIPELTAAVRCG